MVVKILLFFNSFRYSSGDQTESESTNYLISRTIIWENRTMSLNT